MKKSVVLKGLSYVLIPVFVIIVVINTMYAIWLIENEDVKSRATLEETDMFANTYISAIDNALSKTQRSKYYFSTDIIETNIVRSYYSSLDAIKYVIVDNESGKIYTNLDENIYSLEELKNKLKSENLPYFNYNGETKQVDTNINNNRIKNLDTSYLARELEEHSTYEIYTTLNDDLSLFNELTVEKIAFNMVKTFGDAPIITIPLFIVLTICLCIYLLLATGHKKGYKGIYLNRIDKCPIEISGAIIITCIVLVSILLITVCDYRYIETRTENIILATVMGTLIVSMYALIAWIVTIIIKKIKSHTLWNSSLIYKFLVWLQTTIDTIFANIGTNIKIIALFIGTILISIILFNIDGIGILLLLVFWVLVVYAILVKVNDFNKIKQALKGIYNGQTNIELNTNEFKGELKETSIYINDIQNGFSNAINESIKSERMKTELITNVSHDIKTPLTSIINYVDLLKTENIKNEKAKEYIEILEGKSQRLKKLIEDLVEVSKASSGNLKLNIEKINLVELIKQTTGEFEDKFKEKNLIIETNMLDNNIYINADNRYMYRVIENIFSNISKYALEGSRVYIDVNKNKDQAKIEIKNISKEKLNISADELMQRFVRGDKSRTTEGSGLGLSISKSLVELQNGKFNIIIDGDLFKVEIVF